MSDFYGRIFDKIDAACPTDFTVEDWKDFIFTMAHFKLRVIKRHMIQEGTWNEQNTQTS